MSATQAEAPARPWRAQRQPTRITSPFRSVARLVMFVTLTSALIPVQAALVAVGSRATATFPRFYHRIMCRVLGFQVTVRGRMHADAPVLYVSNHLSYIDITILGSIIPGAFVAKAEVADWPFFGLLAKLQRTVFVDRRRGSTGEQRHAIERRLEAGDRLILFPEGTSGDGNRVLPFKSALLAAAGVDEGRLPVQPVTIAYTRLDGVPLGRALRPYYAWYGDMDLAGHAFEMLGLGRTTVEITFHPTTCLAEHGSRKNLANACYHQVNRGLSASNAGRALDRSSVGRPT